MQSAASKAPIEPTASLEASHRKAGGVPGAPAHTSLYPATPYILRTGARSYVVGTRAWIYLSVIRALTKTTNVQTSSTQQGRVHLWSTHCSFLASEKVLFLLMLTKNIPIGFS